jgi:arginine N-succinyltransferase
VVGRVGEETQPARRLLEKLGFQHKDMVDPFDGGPHLEAATDEISIVRNTFRAELAGTAAASACTHSGFVSVLNDDGEFRAIATPFALDGKHISIPRAVMGELGWSAGLELGVSVLEGPAPKPARSSRRAAPRQGKVRQ